MTTTMCAINPKRQKHLTLSVYTTADLSEEEFTQLVAEKALTMEVKLNEDMRLRWHITERTTP